MQEPQHKQRGLKVRRPQQGFFSRRKLVFGKRNIQDRHERRKLHYKCLEEMVLSREQAIQSLRRELEMVNAHCLCYIVSSFILIFCHAVYVSL